MRLVFSTFGTFGDVNPVLGMGVELVRRGHTVVLAAPEMFRRYATANGLGFSPVRPDQRPDDAALIAMIYDRRHGTERGLREFLFPALRHSYDDLVAAVRQSGGADLLLSSELSYAAPLVAEKLAVPWASYVLAPFSFFSGYDPPVLPPHPVVSQLLEAVPGAGRLMQPFARAVTRTWAEPVYSLRRELGLPPGKHPLFEAKHAPRLVLALFSSLLGRPQPDWPPHTQQPGFIFFDREPGKTGAPPELTAFLDGGAPPVVFTLGSAAVLDPGDFWCESARAAELLGVRAVLLTGSLPGSTLPLPRRDLCMVPYAPFSELFPRAAAVVHQGGIGTTAQALRAGQPMLVMPYSHDQPDNARRMRTLGVATVLRREQYKGARVARAIRPLLEERRYRERAQLAQAHLAAEDGLRGACDAIEAAAGAFGP